MSWTGGGFVAEDDYALGGSGISKLEPLWEGPCLTPEQGRTLLAELDRVAAERDHAQNSALREEEHAMHSGGILSDVCDVLFEDESRAALHGYDGVLERARELVAERNRLKGQTLLSPVAEVAALKERARIAEAVGGLAEHQGSIALEVDWVERAKRWERLKTTRRITDFIAAGCHDD